MNTCVLKLPLGLYIFYVKFLSRAETRTDKPRVKTSVLLPEWTGAGLFYSKLSNKIGERYIPVLPLSDYKNASW